MTAALACITLACASATRQDGEPGPGQVVASLATSPAKCAVWLQGGAELAYVAQDGSATPDTEPRYVVKAVRVRDGVERTLSAVPVAGYSCLARSADGTALYAISVTMNGGNRTYGLQDVLSGRDVFPPDIAPGPLTVSPDGHAVVYATLEGGAAVLDLESGTSSQLPCLGNQIASPPASEMYVYSPSGQELLCPKTLDVYVGQPLNLAVVDLSTGLFRDVQVPLRNWIAAQWGSEGPSAIGRPLGDAAAVVSVDVDTGASRTIYTPPSGSSAGWQGGAVAPDGNHVALIEHECLFGWSSCDCGIGRLVLVDLQTGDRKILASLEMRGFPFPSRSAFSDDGSQIAYNFGDGQLRVQTVK